MERRALLGGICLAVGGVPLVAFYGEHPFGLVGGMLVVVGLLISYGAYTIE